LAVVFQQLSALGQGFGGTRLNAYFQGLFQLLDIEVEELWLVKGIHAGQRESLELFIVLDATGVAKGIVAIDDAQGIAVDKRKDGYHDLKWKTEVWG